jgi:N-acetylglucosaminyl-diphospho-decaprenol L-rhamnosyltransferase
MMSGPDITISIVTYNSRTVIENCIRSILATAQDVKIRIIVVDNSSGDGSADLVKSLFPDITLIENSDNAGFGRAHNQSFRISNGRYFLVLNPDTIVFPGTIQKLIAFMDSNPSAGVAGCKIYWDDEKKFMFPDLRIHTLKTAIIQFTRFCSYFPDNLICRQYRETAYRVWDAGLPIEVDGVTGGLLFIRREVFESAGLFDEEYFLFFEEHDLLRRIKKKGWKIYYLPDAEIQHLYEESFRNSQVDIPAVYMRSAFYYYKKHYGLPGLLFLKSLIALNRFFTQRESVHANNTTSELCPENGRLIITWPPHKGAKRYLAEVSYSASFCDRGGMYIYGEMCSLDSSILSRLPDNMGFIRILPVYDDNTTGNVLKVVKITNRKSIH